MTCSNQAQIKERYLLKQKSEEIDKEISRSSLRTFAENSPVVGRDRSCRSVKCCEVPCR